MSKSSLLSFVFNLVLVTLVLSGPVIFSHETSYTPAVTPGQWAEYKVLNNTCQPASSYICMLQNGSSLADTDFGVLQVSTIDRTSVTLKLSTVSRSGVGSQRGLLVDVSSGTSNVTGFAQGPPGLQGPSSDCFVLAGSLNASDQIWNTNDAPKLNQMLTETVLGVQREVNFLNYTSYSSYPLQVSVSSGFAFDRLSGIVIESSFSYSVMAYGSSSQGIFRIAMVDNNIWRSSSLPDFGLAATPSTINTRPGSSGNSTITVTRVNGLSATVSLTATPSSTAITCSLSPSRLTIGGWDRSTLSCSGSPGTYTVVVRGDSGYSSHSIRVVVTDRITNSSPGQTASNLQTPFIYAGIGIAGVIAALALTLRRRKPTDSTLAPREEPSPVTPT